MAQVTPPPGFELVEEPAQGLNTDGLPPGFVVDGEQPQQGSGGASATIGAVRAVPAVARSVAGFAARHPAATQKMIGAGISTGAGTVGAAVGGVPGAVVGASIRGVTPAQATIRRVAGQLAGETPEVAEKAARGLGIQNYGKEVAGVRVKPTDIIRDGKLANTSLENYAESNGARILKLYDPAGNIVSGPDAIKAAPKPGLITRALNSPAMGAVNRVLLKPLQGMTGMTDFAQTVEPTRTDIGWMGMGAKQADPTPAELQAITARNRTQVDTEAQRQAALRQRILAMIGLGQ